MILTTGIIADSYNAPAGGSWTPASLTGLEFWLDASDTATITHSSGAVSQWNDKSSAGRHVEQLTALDQPITGTRTINSLNAIDFDGVNHWLSTISNWSTLSQPFTIAAVGVIDTVTSSTRSFVRGDSSRYLGKSGVANQTLNYGVALTIAGLVAGETNLHFGIANGASSYIKKDGFFSSTGNSGTSNLSLSKLAVGADITGTNVWDGLIGEIVITSNIMDAASILSLENYLSAKWGVILPTPVTSPTSLTGLQVWFDASDGASITSSGGLVSQWNDKSGNGRHVVQATGSAKPLTGSVTINGLNALTFDGTDDRLTGSSAQLVDATTGEWTSFIVFKSSTTTGIHVMFDQDPAAPRTAMFGRTSSAATQTTAYNTANTSFADPAGGSFSTTLPNIACGIRYPTVIQTFLNSSELVGTSTTGTPATASNVFTVGSTSAASPVSFWLGDIAEIFVYNRALSLGERRGVELHLKSKWGTP